MPNYMKIDAHQHFWKYDPVKHSWIDDSIKLLQRDFLPPDLGPLLAASQIESCIAVQADQSEAENDFLLQLAREHEIVKGVVGWVDLTDERLAERLEVYAGLPYFKGVRHIAQSEADDFLLRSDVQRGIGMLASFDLCYDILIYAHQLPAAIQLARQFPEQAFVLDHLAKPRFSEGLEGPWRTDIRALAECPNVSCKLSGMVTETDKHQWQAVDFRAFTDIVLDAFGTDRLLYGSDWPVCLLAASYAEQLGVVEGAISDLSDSEQAKIMGQNTIDFYNLSW